MKKLFALIAAAFVTVSGFALEAKVLSVTGKVEVKKENTWVALSKGDILQKGQMISTGFKAKAVLQIAGSKLTVNQLTRLTIEQLVSNEKKDETQVYIESGNVDADVASQSGKRVGFKVRSPVATASVRGTSFHATANGKIKTYRGMVSKSQSESHGPAISESEQPTETPDANTKTTAFTSTTELGKKGTPVFAGWESTTDSITMKTTTPYAEKTAAAGLDRTTGSLLTCETINTNPSATATAIGGNSAKAKSGTLIMDIQFETNN